MNFDMDPDAFISPILAEDPEDTRPVLPSGQTIRKEDLAEALGVRYPTENARLTREEHQSMRLELVNAVQAWKMWHLRTHRIAILSDHKGGYRALHPGQQAVEAERVREHLISKGLHTARLLLENIEMPENEDERMTIRQARISNEARRRAAGR